jgi:hypothetical protein
MIPVAVMSCNDAVAPDAPADLAGLFLLQWSPNQSDGYGGHAFLIEGPGTTRLAVTAYHVAGPELSTPPVDESRVNAWLTNPTDPSVVLRVGARYPISGARTIGPDGSQDDMAAFHVLDWDEKRAFRLATQLPAVGDTVWVLALHQGGTNPHPLSGPRRHAARVDISDAEAFVYSYVGSANANSTSGAAVLNRNGEVVGINVGTRVMNAAAWNSYRARYSTCCSEAADDDVVGIAVGVQSMMRMLRGFTTG